MIEDGAGLSLVNLETSSDDPLVGVIEAILFDGSLLHPLNHRVWAVASSGDYAFYRLSLQGTSAKLQGYDSAFVTLAKPTVTYPDSSTVRLAWNEADMGIGSTQFRAGFGAGWCGSDTGSFCDHFPDNWGYYYTGYDQSNFYSLRW